MSKKMKRELAETDKFLESIVRRRKTYPSDPYSKTLKHELYFTQKRADIANAIGRKRNGN